MWKRRPLRRYNYYDLCPRIPPLAPSAIRKTVSWLLETPAEVLQTKLTDVVSDNIETRHQITAESAELHRRCPKGVWFIVCWYFYYFRLCIVELSVVLA